MPDKSNFFNPPNFITIARILSVPFVMILLVSPTPTRSLVACILFTVAALSDLLDGYLARKYKQESVFGTFLDPLADKILVIGAMIMILPFHWIPTWMVAVFIIRDLVITGLRSVAAGEGIIISASLIGKFKTSYESVGLGMIILHYPIFGIKVNEVGIMLLFIGLILAIISALDYLYQFFATNKK